MTKARTIRFHAAVWLADDPGDEEVARDFPAEDIHRLLSELDGETIREPAGVGRYHLVETYGQRANAWNLVLYRVSAEDLPMLYDTATRAIRPLDEVLGTDAVDVAEPTYFGFFPDGVAGFVYNHRGPKTRDLERYIMSKVEMRDFEFRPLPRLDVLQALEAAGEAKVFDVRLPVEFGDAFDDTPLAEAVSFGRSMNSTTVEVILRAKTTEDRDGMVRRISDWVRGLSGDQRRLLEAMRVQLGAGEDYKGDRALDLLDEHLVIEAQIETVTGRRYLERDDAIRQLTLAYEGLSDDITHGLEAITGDRA